VAHEHHANREANDQSHTLKVLFLVIDVFVIIISFVFDAGSRRSRNSPGAGLFLHDHDPMKRCRLDPSRRV
jgi:hypothetical protein